MKIIPATEAHLAAVRAIYGDAIIERIATSDVTPPSLDAMTAIFRQISVRYPYLVGVIEGEVVGYANLYPISPREGYRFTAENAVYVRRDQRGRGLGRQLLSRLLELAPQSDLHHIVARVFAHNQKSRRLHTELGFREVGVQREVARLDDKWFDVVLFEKILRP